MDGYMTDLGVNIGEKLEKELKASDWKEVYIGLWVHKKYPNSCIDLNTFYPVYRVGNSIEKYINRLSDVIGD